MAKRKVMSGNQTKTIARAATATVLAACIFGGGMAVGMGWITDWTYEAPKTEQTETPDGGGNSSAVITPGTENGISLLSAEIPVSAYEANNVSAQAESAYTLTATITPSDATNKAVTYTAAFANPDSAWASGKNVSDYVTVTQASAGSLTATVSCLQAFGEQIIITVSSQDNYEVSATCTVDYLRKPLGADLSFKKKSSSSSDEFTWTFNHATPDASVEFPILKNVGSSIDQEWAFAWENRNPNGGTAAGTYASYTTKAAYSDVYTIDNSETSMSSLNIAITQEYYDILTGLGYTVSATPETYITFPLGSYGYISIGNMILGAWTNSSFANYTAYTALRAALKDKAGTPMFRLKYYFVSIHDSSEASGSNQIYNVSFSSSSFANILADSVTLDETELIF